MKITSFISLFLLCFITLVAQAEEGSISGRVVTPEGQPINSAQIQLFSTLDTNRAYSTVQSDSSGAFTLTFDWIKIEEANARGSKWKVVASKTNYASMTRNVVLGGNSVFPKTLPMSLKALTNEAYFDAVDGCRRRNRDASLRIFRLNASLPPADVTKFLDDLSYYLEKGITTELQANRLLDTASKFKVNFCNGVPVDQPDQAISFGQRLNAMGVIWGYLENAESRLNCSIRFTDLVSDPVEIRTRINYDQDFEEKVLEVNKTPDSAYLAFAALTLAKSYLKQNKPMISQRYLTYGLGLQNVPPDLTEELTRVKGQISQSNPARGLTPVGGNP